MSCQRPQRSAGSCSTDPWLTDLREDESVHSSTGRWETSSVKIIIIITEMRVMFVYLFLVFFMCGAFPIVPPYRMSINIWLWNINNYTCPKIFLGFNNLTHPSPCWQKKDISLNQATNGIRFKNTCQKSGLKNNILSVCSSVTLLLIRGENVLPPIVSAEERVQQCNFTNRHLDIACVCLRNTGESCVTAGMLLLDLLSILK